MRRLIAAALRRLLRWVEGHAAHGDPWHSFEYAVPSSLFGAGSQHDFRWYFGGDSAVEVASVDEICDWLIACEYASDASLFHERDFWQHPRTFESIRKGDCEDHAIWAWRKLVELGLEAQLMIGRWHPREGEPIQHAWVVFRDEGREYVLEAVRKQRAAMILPLDDVRAQYEPMFSVDQRFTRYGYVGYLRHVERLISTRASRGGPRGAPSAVSRETVVQ